MRSRVTTIALLLVAVSVALACAEDRPPVLEKYPLLLDGQTEVQFLRDRPRPAILSEQSPITGFAFGPGRLEVAYCGPTAEEERSGLWVVGAWASKQELQRDAGGARLAPSTAQPEDKRLYRTPDAPPRLLWTAPPGVTLRGPVWWAPNGTQIALRASTGEQCALISVDYATGETAKLGEGEITAVAWSPDGKRIAYVKESREGSAVWLQSFPPAEERALGPGGLDLRWSTDGNAVYWITPQPGETWVQQAWEVGAEAPQQIAHIPARPDGTVWSPDGRLCAAVAGEPGAKQLVIYSARATTGETVVLEGAHPERVLSWTPDSRLVTVLADRNLPVAVAVTPEAALPLPITRVLKLEKMSCEEARAAMVGPPLTPEAGPPSWSANGEMVAYVYHRGEGRISEFARWCIAGRGPSHAERITKQLGEHLPKASTALIALGLDRQLISREEMEYAAQLEEHPGGGEAERLRIKVLSNVNNIAVALNMYLSDYLAFPDIQSMDDLRQVLGPYVKDQSVFMLPDTDQPVVEYVLPPDLMLEDIQDPAMTPMVVVRILPDWDIVGFVDGHAKMYRKGEDYGLDNLPQPGE
jgi:hypothetical protein